MVKIKGQIKSESDAINRGYLENRNPYVLEAGIRGLHNMGTTSVEIDILEDCNLNWQVLEQLSYGFYTKIFDNHEIVHEVWNYTCRGHYNDNNMEITFTMGSDYVTLTQIDYLTFDITINL
jgi:hypothetical protein